MRNTDLLYAEVCSKEIVLTHQCRTENGFMHDEKFTIMPESIEGVDINTGEFEQCTIVNQYGQQTKINCNQIESIVGYTPIPRPW